MWAGRAWLARTAGSIGWRESTRNSEMAWKTYAIAVLLFNLWGSSPCICCCGCRTVAAESAGMPAAPPDLAFNTAVSFATNTNWQSYGGETTLSYLTQMLGLTVQNFVSAATGMAVLVALIRGLARRSAATIGNFWFDLVRSTLTFCCRCRWSGASAGVAGSGAELPPLSDGHADSADSGRRRKACDGTRYCRWARRLRRSRSSNSAPTAAASSTSIRPTR